MGCGATAPRWRAPPLPCGPFALRAATRAALLFLALAGAAGPTAAAEDADDDGVCPAGPEGDGCRADAGSSAGSQTFDWRAFPGCAIPAGDDVGDAELLTVAQAKRRCGSQENCVAFTFEGADPEGPLSGGPMWVHLKSSFDCIEAEWVAYRKVERQRSAGSAPAPPPPPPPPPRDEEANSQHSAEEGDGVALCLSGQARMLQFTAKAMEQHLLEVLQPDVFMYGPRVASREDGPELHELGPYVTVAQFEDEDIRSRLYSETRNAERVLDLEYLEVQGNWFGNQCLSTALRDNRPGSALCMYYNQQKCLDMVREAEEERGRPYAWLVVSRTDFRWVAPHPPLELLKERDAVWIPSGSDWEGGINDRHAAMPRQYAEHYLSGWRLITSGEAKDVMLETLGPMKVNGYPGPNTECFLRARLAHFDVPVERFPNVAYLTCTQSVKSRWTQCSGTSTNDNPGWLYKEEMEHATRVAKCVRSSWTPRKMEDCRDDISHLYRGIR